MDLCWQVMSPLFNMIYMLVIAFFPRSKGLLISWLQSPSAVIWSPPKWSLPLFPLIPPLFWHEVMGPDAMIYIFWILSFKRALSPSSLTFINRLFSSLLSARGVVLLPGKSDGQRCLVGCRSGGLEELDTIEWLHFHFSLSCVGEGNGSPLQC